MAKDEIEAGYWVPLQEYLQLQQVSLSTARRRIKAGLVKAELRRGKYYIYVLWERPDEKGNADDGPGALAAQVAILQQQVQALHQQIRRLTQENGDLRMLAQAYETKLASYVPEVTQS
ncbi:MAG: hypothetical protein J6Y94_03985 [Bacteriovoracaceae bacterium]|nr:hypothetical protein [Bacteriovoracaceae bacterium]